MPQHEHAKLCANCRKRPPVDGKRCRSCIANAAVARKRRANARAAMRDYARPMGRAGNSRRGGT